MSWRPQVTPQINYEGPAQVTFHIQNNYQSIANGYAQYRQQVIPPQYVQQPVPHGYAPHTMIPFHDRGRQPFENVGSQPLHHGQDMEQLNHSSNAQGSPPGESQAEVYGSPAPIPSGYVPRILTEAAYEAKIAERHKHDPNSDYPKEPAAQQQIIKDLFEAFKNTDGIIDKPQVGLAFKDGSIPDEEIELVCWELVVRTIPKYY
jgi:hypothetical protein